MSAALDLSAFFGVATFKSREAAVGANVGSASLVVCDAVYSSGPQTELRYIVSDGTPSGTNAQQILAGTVAFANGKMGTLDLGEYVEPEQYGYTPSASATAQADAIQAAVDTGLEVRFGPFDRYAYYINRQITPPAHGRYRIRGTGSRNVNSGGYGTLIYQTFVGTLFKPADTYDFEGLVMGPSGIGSVDGAIAIGNNDSNVLIGRGRCVDLRFLPGYEHAIYFGDGVQHPLGLEYRDIYLQGMRTGGIRVGGSVTPSGGESLWSIDAVVGTNLNFAPIEYTPTVTANTPSTAFDRITWTGTVPEYGFLVIRSANGISGWEVVPNWTDRAVTALNFDAAKNVGETWFYKVVRQTRGLSLFRGKGVLLSNIQMEYFGIGVYLDNIKGVVTSLYSETKGSLPNVVLTPLWAKDTRLTVQRLWSDGSAFGAVNENSTLYGDLWEVIVSKIAAIAMKTLGDFPVTDVRNLVATSSVALLRQLTGAANEALGFRYGLLDDKRISPSPRSGFGLHRADLTSGSASTIFTFTVPSNSAVNFSLALGISVYTGGVARQSFAATLNVSALSAAGTVAANAALAGGAKVEQQGTLRNAAGDVDTSPEVSVSVSGSVVTVRIGATTDRSTPTMRCFMSQPTFAPSSAPVELITP